MGQSDSKPEQSQPDKTAQEPDTPATEIVETSKLGKSGKKICCSCPETKAARDDCVVMNGEDKCKEIIEAHKNCLRAEGFDIR